jgi:DNA-binding transcriptional MerR regulator
MVKTGPETDAIPDKLYFKIGEVSQITELPPYVLRFWETEFKKINPKRTSSGQRLYRRKDVALILQIKHLLYDKKYTIPGAIKHLNKPATAVPPEKTDSTSILADIRKELLDIRNLVSK